MHVMWHNALISVKVTKSAQIRRFVFHKGKQDILKRKRRTVSPSGHYQSLGAYFYHSWAKNTCTETHSVPFLGL